MAPNPSEKEKFMKNLGTMVYVRFTKSFFIAALLSPRSLFTLRTHVANIRWVSFVKYPVKSSGNGDPRECVTVLNIFTTKRSLV